MYTIRNQKQTQLIIGEIVKNGGKKPITKISPFWGLEIEMGEYKKAVLSQHKWQEIKVEGRNPDELNLINMYNKKELYTAFMIMVHFKKGKKLLKENHQLKKLLIGCFELEPWKTYDTLRAVFGKEEMFRKIFSKEESKKGYVILMDKTELLIENKNRAEPRGSVETTFLVKNLLKIALLP